MRIVSLDIENYRAIERRHLDFNDNLGQPQRMTVLAGPNGCGKTSILFAIVQALRGVMGYRTLDVPTPSRDDIRLPVASAGWSDRQPRIQVDVELEFDHEEQKAVPELLKILKMNPPPPLPGGRVRVRWGFPPEYDEDGRRMGWWTADVAPHLEYVRSWLDARKLAIRAWRQRIPGMRYEYLHRIGGLSFFPQDRNLRERVMGEGVSGQSTPRPEQDGVDSDVELDYERSVPRERSISEVLQYLSNYAKNREAPLPDEQNWEKKIKDTFARICAPKRYLGYLYREDDPLGAPVLQDGDHRYPLSQAASGEQVVLEYITRLTSPAPAERNIVLIDEPEIHLHPAWIRQLYLALPRIGTCNQYILTTHSIELRQRAAADNALVPLGTLGEQE